MSAVPSTTQCCLSQAWTAVHNTVLDPLAEKVRAVFAVLKEGWTLSNHWFDPFGYWVQTTRFTCYRNHPVGARCLTIPVNAILGLVKVFAFPAVAVAIMAAKVIPIGVTVAIGAVALPLFGLIIAGVVVKPIIAVVKFCQGKPDEGKKWLAAWAFSLLAAAGAAGFLYCMAFHFTLIQSSTLIAVGGAASMMIHIYRVAKEPLSPTASKA